MQFEFLSCELRAFTLAGKKSSFFNIPSVTLAHEVAGEIKVRKVCAASAGRRVPYG
jgi:hypothetical protein